MRRRRSGRSMAPRGGATGSSSIAAPDRCFFSNRTIPDDWPQHWSFARVSAPLATYMSAAERRSGGGGSAHRGRPEPPRRKAGIAIRTFDPARADAELRRMFALSLASFSGTSSTRRFQRRNSWRRTTRVLPLRASRSWCCSPRSEERWPDSCSRCRTCCRRDGACRRHRDSENDRGRSGRGRHGSRRRADRTSCSAARGQLGFRRAIHALMHETNVSRTISGRYARTIRRYALFSRRSPADEHRQHSRASRPGAAAIGRPSSSAAAASPSRELDRAAAVGGRRSGARRRRGRACARSSSARCRSRSIRRSSALFRLRVTAVFVDPSAGRERPRIAASPASAPTPSSPCPALTCFA